MKFVLLALRENRHIADAEYDDFLALSGLGTEELDMRVLDRPDSELGDFSDVDGVFIGGSAFTITKPYDAVWQPAVSERLVEFVQKALEHQRFPIIATCYGASLFAHYLGGQVGSDFAEEAGVTKIALTEQAANDPLCAQLPQEFLGFGGHKDSVLQLPQNAVLLAGGPTCPVHMYRMGSNVWATQFHPEMDGDRIARRLSFYEDAGYFSPERHNEVYDDLRGHDTSASNSILRAFVQHARDLRS